MIIRLLAIIPAIFALLILALPARALNAPWPPGWYAQAMCIHSHESTDWHKTTTWTGAPSNDHGGMQIDVGTWRSMLSHGYRLTRGFPAAPELASPYQQLVVAYLIWVSNGHRFGGSQWPNTARACGVP